MINPLPPTLFLLLLIQPPIREHGHTTRHNREQQRSNDRPMPNMKRGSILRPVDETGADPTEIGDSNRHGDRRPTLHVTTCTTSSPSKHHGDTGEDATRRDDGSSVCRTGMSSGCSIKHRITRNGHAGAKHDKRSTELHVIGHDTNDDGEEAAGDVWWGGEELCGSGRVAEFVDDGWDEEGECIDGNQDANVDEYLEPAFPVC